MSDTVTFDRTELFEFLGAVALPPWSDNDGRWLGSDIDCAPIAATLRDWVDAHDLTVVEEEDPAPKTCYGCAEPLGPVAYRVTAFDKTGWDFHSTACAVNACGPAYRPVPVNVE